LRVSFILLFLHLLCHSLLSAQEHYHLKGRVVDAKLEHPVSFATIQMLHRGIGTYANDSGRFSLSLSMESAQNDSLLLRSIGYRDTIIAIADVIRAKSDKIALQPKIFHTPEVSINGLKAEDLVRKAIEHIPANMQSDALELKGNYYQWHRENDRYVRFIQAGISIWSPSYSSLGKRGRMVERISIDRLRRSNVYEQNGFEHGDHLSDLMLENCLRYPIGGPLNLKSLSLYAFEYADVQASHPGLEEVAFFYHHPGDEVIQSGSMLIELGSFAIQYIQVNSYPSNSHFESEHSDWVLLNSTVDLHFMPGEKGYYLHSARQQYNHEVWDSKLASYRYLVEETFLWVADSVEISGDQARSGFHSFTNLYDRNYEYQSSDWAELPMDLFPEGLVEALDLCNDPERQFSQNGL
jgi:hypothetical protein